MTNLKRYRWTIPEDNANAIDLGTYDDAPFAFVLGGSTADAIARMHNLQCALIDAAAFRRGVMHERRRHRGLVNS